MSTAACFQRDRDSEESREVDPAPTADLGEAPTVGGSLFFHQLSRYLLPRTFLRLRFKPDQTRPNLASFLPAFKSPPTVNCPAKASSVAKRESAPSHHLARPSEMQRQLNLSPLPKQQHDDGGDGSDATEAIPLWVPGEAAEEKADKAAGGRAERSIHLIPLLTFLCFLLLFLCSHIPSASDMSSFGGGAGGGSGGGKAGNRRLKML
uniref:Uncharacterized protein n=2 Tax=Avena sativa TaxID=4498 RepID=A0ACD5ZKK2_AVESA